MATYYSNKVTLNAAGVNTTMPKWLETGDAAVWAFITLPSGTALAVNDTIQLLDVPAGVTITGFTVDTGVLDGGGSPAIVFKVGDAVNTARYMSGSALAKTGGVAVSNVAGGALGNPGYTATTRVYATITTAAAAAMAAAATFGVLLNYSADP